jgi:lactoylglutathione lyase
MLYVHNQEEALKFWTEKAGFSLISEESHGEMRWFEIAPIGTETSIILHDRAQIAKMQPELNLQTPSLMFFSEDLDRLYQAFQKKEITVGELVHMPSGKVFNFADHEGNYFAVMEK